MKNTKNLVSIRDKMYISYIAAIVIFLVMIIGIKSITNASAETLVLSIIASILFVGMFTGITKYFMKK